MKKPLAVLEVRPLYHQIVVQDVETQDLPEWETGEESFVATDHAIYVATQLDTNGKVLITVQTERPAKGQLVVATKLRVASGQIEIGSPIAGAVARIKCEKGQVVDVEIFGASLPRPAKITVFLAGLLCCAHS